MQNWQPGTVNTWSWAGTARSLLHGLCSVGTLYPPSFSPERYPRPYNHDLCMIAADMWKVLQLARVNRETKEIQIETKSTPGFVPVWEPETNRIDPDSLLSDSE